MTDEELERKAEMYEIHVCGIHANSKLRKAYKDGYKEGRRIESDLIFESWCKDPSSPCGFLLERETEIETLKKSIKKMKKKANEWHKQDIDDIYDLISKDWDIRYFICIMKDKSRVTAIGNCDEGCNGEVSVNLFFEHDDEKYYMDDIVWWKEIVPPKEIKENG